MRKFGFDIGIASIGWAVVDTGESDNEFEIVDCGVRIFEAGEARNSTGKIIPSALPRREARSTRRRLARRKARLNAVKRLLCKEFDIKFNDFIMQGENLPKIFETSKETKSPWYLRKESLERKLTQSELARVILHIAKHRGYDDLRYPIVTKDESEKSKEKDSQIEQDAKKIEDEKAKYSITNNLKESEKYQSGVLMLFEKNSDEKGELKDNAIFRNKAEKIDKIEEKIKNKLKQIVKDNSQNKKINLENLKSKDGKALNVKDLISKIYDEAKTKEKYSYKDLRDILLEDKNFKSALNLDENFKISGSKKDDLSDKFIDFEKDNKIEKQGIYTNSIPQSANQKELNSILKKQAEFGHKFSDNFVKNLAEKIFSSRPLQDFENKVGECSFIKGEKRAPKFSPLAQEFIALTKIINTLTNIYKDTGEIIKKEKIIEILNLAKSKNRFEYKDLAKALNLQNYQIKGSKKADLSDKFIDFEKYNKFTKICKSKFGDKFCDIYNDKFNEIAKICTYKKDFKSLKQELLSKNYDFGDDEITRLLDLGFKNSVDLGFSALKKILPFMCDGNKYDEAWKLAGLVEQGKEEAKTELLPPLCKTHFANELTNPVVNRAISQYRKVLNAIILKYGLPDEIHFELAREATKNAKDRKEIENAQNENFAKNERAKKFCEEIGLPINDRNILKVKLWQEQKEFSVYSIENASTCPYSDGKIKIEHLLSENMLEIDHILPLSRSFDDSQSNKVLVFRSENQDKGALTPFEKWGNTEQWQDMKKRFETLFANNKAKLNKLLIENFKDKQQAFGDRALNDTAYLSKLIKDYTSECLKLPEPQNGKKQQIFAISGIFTSVLRHYYGLGKKNRENHLHHAQDAFIIAMSDSKMVKAVSEYMRDLEENKKREFQSDKTKQFSQSVASDLKNSDFKTKRKFKYIPEFRNKVLEAVSKIFVSKPPRKKVTGELHKAKIYSKNDPKFSDRKLREIRNGLAENGEMPRVDIFTKKGKFYAVPIYTMDFAKGELPNITAGSTNHKIDDSFEFKFSLFKSDLIRIKKKGMKEPVCCYFASIHSGTSAITIEKQNNDYANLTDDEKLLFMDKKQEKLQPSVGIQNLEVFEKNRVSPLGELYCLLSDNPNIKHEPEKLLTQQERAKIKQEKSQKG